MAARKSTRKSGKTASKRARRAPAAKKRATRGQSERGRDGAAGRRRPIWSGQLRLALVSVPVLVFAATVSGARLAFHQVHAPTGKRIRYQKVAPGVGPVDTDEIVKGYEIAKDRYVLLEDEEIDAVKLEARKTVELVQFVDHCEIDPIWFDRPYYVVPDGELAEDAYRVLRDALRATRRIGLGQLVMRGREYIVALKPCGDGLMIETLRFADEVREAAPFFAEVSGAKSDAELLELAETLIDKRTAAFDPETFKDRYTEALRAVIEAKARKKPVEVEETELPSGGAEIIDLVDALKRSVRGGKSRGGGKSSTRRKAG